MTFFEIHLSLVNERGQAVFPVATHAYEVNLDCIAATWRNEIVPDLREHPAKKVKSQVLMIFPWKDIWAAAIKMCRIPRNVARHSQRLRTYSIFEHNLCERRADKEICCSL